MCHGRGTKSKDSLRSAFRWVHHSVQGCRPARCIPLNRHFGKLIADETEKWGKVIRFANIKPE